jgi:hypothetical protein
MMISPSQSFRNRRRSPRAAVELPASVVTMSAYKFLEVVNLSPTGAKLRGPTPLEVGKSAMFRLEGLHLLCKVVWVRDDLCGIRFDEPIAPRLVAEFQEAGAAAQGTLTPEEEPADVWADAIAL